MVSATLGAIGVDYCELRRRGVKKAVRGEEVNRHDISPVEKPGQEENSRQKGTIYIKGNTGLTSSAGSGGKHRKHSKRGQFAPIDQGVL